MESPRQAANSNAQIQLLPEARIERRNQKNEDTVRKLSRAVEQSADLVMITDREGVIEYVNPAFELLTGYSPGELMGQTPRVLKSGQQTAELYKELWQTILSGNVFRCIMVNQKKNGEMFVAEKTITPLRDGAGSITHFISNDRDITERRQMENQLQQAQKMDAVGRLAGGVAHDFNNLLMVISSYAELMLDSLAPQHPLRRNVNEIQKASRRAADLTRQLLAFGRKQMQTLQLLDLNSLIEDFNKMLPRLIGEDVELVFVPGPDLGKVKADPVQIEQILMNLVANARDAMPRGGRLVIETASVRLDDAYVQQHAIVPPGDYVLLTVTDSGLGIAPEHLSHIFEPFYTTKEEAKAQGLAWLRCTVSSNRTAGSSGCTANRAWEQLSKCTCLARARPCRFRSLPCRWKAALEAAKPCYSPKMKAQSGSPSANFLP